MGLFIHLPAAASCFLFVWQCYRVSFVETLFIGIAANTISRIATLVHSILALLDPERFAYFGDYITTGFWRYVLIVVSYVFTYILAWFVLIRRIQGFSLLKNATRRIVALSAVMLVVNQIWGMNFGLNAVEFAGPLLSFLEYLCNLICCVSCLCIHVSGEGKCSGGGRR